MGLTHSPLTPTNGLVLCLDSSNRRSYAGAGTTWRDLSGNGNDGTLINGVAYSGQGMSFDGVDDYVSFIPLTPALGFSFACWFKAVNASRTRQSLFSNSRDASPDIYLHIESTSGTTNAMNFYSSSVYFGTSSTFTQDTNWHHYAWTTDATGKVRYYRDGVFLSSPGLLWTPSNDNSNFATIGAIIDLIGPGFTAQGQIDDCRRYSRTLTESEIRALYNYKRKFFTQ